MSIEIPVRTPPPRKKTKEPEVAVPQPVVHNGDGELQEPAFDLPRFYEMVNALTIDFLQVNFDHQTLRDLHQQLADAGERIGRRIQQMESLRRELLCDGGCGKPLPGGRFVGEIIVRDEITQELRALRACSEGCYREISRIASERRQRGQGNIRGTIAL